MRWHGVVAALVMVALLAAGTGPEPAEAAPVPVTISLPAFVPFPDMATCRAIPLTSCFRFADGDVVGQPDLLSALLVVARLLGWPLAGCTPIGHLGPSQAVVEVEASGGFPLAIGAGTCDDVRRGVADGTVYLITPGARRSIPPTVGSVVHLVGAVAPR